MNREEFMLRLEAKLLDIQENEKNEALKYYEDYFNDAGVENEEEVLHKLGNPEQVAESIKAGLNGNLGEFTETGYRSRQQEEDGAWNEVSAWSQGSAGRQSGPQKDAGEAFCGGNPGSQKSNSYESGGTDGGSAYGNAGQQGNPPSPPVKTSGAASKTILIIIACILLSPIILPVAGALLGAVVAVLAALLVAWFSLLGAGIVLFFCGLVSIGTGLVKLFSVPLAGAVLLGLGLLCFGFGLLLVIFMIWLSVKLVPPFMRWLIWLLRKPFDRKGGVS